MRSRLTLRQLQAFIAVAEAGQFTRAAQRFHVSQSALSILIKELEEVLGVMLFDRSTRSLRLTAAGELFLERVRHVVLELDQALLHTRDTVHFRSGRVTIACSTVLASTLVAPFIKAFGMRYPGLRIELLDVAEQDVERRVLEEKADIGIGTHTHEDPEITARPLFRDTYQAVLPDGHRLVSSRQVSWRLLVKEPWIALSPLNPIRREIDSYLKSSGLQMTVGYQVSFLSTALALVRNGLGVSVLPSNAQEATDCQGVVFKTLSGSGPTRQIATFQLKARTPSPAAQRVLDELTEWVRRSRG
jgi:DNA-binding transcriptional LysR family regulator